MVGQHSSFSRFSFVWEGLGGGSQRQPPPPCKKQKVPAIQRLFNNVSLVYLILAPVLTVRAPVLAVIPSCRDGWARFFIFPIFFCVGGVGYLRKSLLTPQITGNHPKPPIFPKIRRCPEIPQEFPLNSY